MKPHGTPTRAQQHRADGESLAKDGGVCEPCRLAWNEYAKHHRSKSNDLDRKAMRILRDRHPGEYARILYQLKEAHDADERE